MVLSDHDIKIEMASGRIAIEPTVDRFIQPASVDLRLGSDFRVFRNSSHVAIDPERDQPDLTERIVIADDAVGPEGPARRRTSGSCFIHRLT